MFPADIGTTERDAFGGQHGRDDRSDNAGSHLRHGLNKKRDDLAVADALARGRGAHQTETIGHLTQHMRNGNVTAAIFLAKAMHGFRDQGPSQDVSINVNTGVLRVPTPVTLESTALPIEDIEDDEAR